MVMMNSSNRSLSNVLARITNKLQQDLLVNEALTELKNLLNVDRVVLYYFYAKWKGQVTFEALSDREYSIIGQLAQRTASSLNMRNFI